MRVGIPREVKAGEGRVGLVPSACEELVRAGHEVFVAAGAGEASGYPDDSYRDVGVVVVEDGAAVYRAASLIVKVKEPSAEELRYLNREHLLFSFLHLAALPELARELCGIGLTAVAFETVEDAAGRLPLLAPMSDIAGRLAVQIGAQLLHRPAGGKGILLGGVAATRRGRVVVLGGGVAGYNAAVLAAGLGAEVTVFDKDRDKLVQARAIGANVTALYPHATEVREYVEAADLAVGAVLITGARAPHVVSEATVRAMEPGSVIVDLSVDQGGCIETTHARALDEPTYAVHGVTHFTVTNIPAAVPRTASQALSAAIAPYVLRLAETHWQDEPGLRSGINIAAGKIVHPALLS
ncbi:MAG TPA: alanine dehydrogenase [Steroidobacteraceae bacterium]|nr:alanine dehydrogenase [Steroidobacteraceae bacterium]